MPKQFNSSKELADYFDAKYAPALKVALAKLNAVQAELSNVKGKFTAAPPPGLPDEVAAQYKTAIAECVKIFGYCDRYLARAQAASKEISAVFKTRGL